MVGFPSFTAGTIKNPFRGSLRKICDVVNHGVEIIFPTRLNTMVLDQTKIAPNTQMIFPAGEVLISIDNTIQVTTTFLGDFEGRLEIGQNVKRKAIVIHAYRLMCHALQKEPSVHIDVDDRSVIKHTGLGSSGATMAAVCVSINELLGNPIKELDLIQYMASNYGEEVDDNDHTKLQCMPSFGGSMATGLFYGGIQVIAGVAMPIMTSNYEGKVILGVPRDYVPGTALNEVERHGKYLFENADRPTDAPVASVEYNQRIAYELLNYALPLLRKGDISGISKMSFEMNFNAEAFGVADYDWFFPRANEIAEHIRFLFEDKHCVALGKSSTGPAFYALVENSEQEARCVEAFSAQNMNVSLFSVYNGKYQTRFL